MSSTSQTTHSDYPVCACQCGCPPEQSCQPRTFSCPVSKEPVRSIKVLDEASQANHAWHLSVLEVIQQLGLSPEVRYVSEPKKTSPYYVDFPALVINEQVVTAGKLLTSEELKETLARFL